MYIVVSKWAPNPEKAKDWEAVATSMRNMLLEIDGVEFTHRFENEEGQIVVIIGYRDEATYTALVKDTNGAVAKAMQEHDVESVGTWISSDRGTTIE